MKTKILIPIILAFLISCKDDPIKNQKKEFTKLSLNYLNNKIKESGSPDVIDSLKLIKVDSLTEAHEVLFLTNYVNSKFKKFKIYLPNWNFHAHRYSIVDSAFLFSSFLSGG